MTAQPMITLNDARRMPQLGLGVWQTPADETASVVKSALEAGYRLVDTAAVYGNEVGVGEGLRTAGLSSDDVFVTTKLWNESQGFERTQRAFEKSLRRLGLDQVDLYLIHWPAPGQDLYLESWRALIQLQKEGLTKSIGVSNFAVEHLRRIIDETGVVPVVNQIELHPSFQQAPLRAFHAEHGIATESWSPLGRGAALSDPVLARIAAKHGRTPAQIVLRWHLDLGLVVIPKSVRPQRIAENFAVFDFHLDEADMTAIAGLDDPAGRMGPDPLAFG
ncbi:MAG TPA: aldo/keto reductase [Caulobacteraceae bacterium]|nr:aldo/keto reductase [Caulobacteraceae bacterium]